MFAFCSVISLGELLSTQNRNEILCSMNAKDQAAGNRMLFCGVGDFLFHLRQCYLRILERLIWECGYHIQRKKGADSRMIVRGTKQFILAYQAEIGFDDIGEKEEISYDSTELLIVSLGKGPRINGVDVAECFGNLSQVPSLPKHSNS
jgi:hypothetical protein